MYATNEPHLEYEGEGVNRALPGMLKESELIYLADPFDVFAGR